MGEGIIRGQKDRMSRGQVFIRLLRYYGAKALRFYRNIFLIFLGEGVSNSHPELVLGSHRMQQHTGQSDVPKKLKQVQHDTNSPKRTYSLINLFSYSPYKKAAFTLAEVLITLGIIGIVAAMTMPSLIANYQKKQTVSQLKKAYSTFAQALVLSQYENGNSSEWNVTELGSSYDDNLAYFEKYWKPYLKVIKVCKTMKECGYDITGYATLSTTSYSMYGQFDNVPGFIYGDGTYAYIRPYPLHPEYVPTLQLLSIDINGAKRPNILGRDVFQFQVDTQRGVITGYYTKDRCTKEKISQENSRACGGKIMADGWEIRDDYPW